MERTRLLKLARLAMLAGIAATLVWPSPALASCMPPQPFPQAIHEAPAVFIGEVTDVSGSGRWAAVEVSQVWKGGVMPAEVEVRGGPGDENSLSSVDRHFKVSVEYLFVPHERRGSVFSDNACTRTTRFRAELARFRPATATDPLPGPETWTPEPDENDNPLRWLLGGAALAGVAVIGLLVLRRR